jgi:hypothetical protein
MLTRARVELASALLATIAATSHVLAQRFRVDCPLPFPMAAQARPIDNICGNSGEARVGPKGLQNEAKNNLCSTGDSILVTFSDLMALQNQVTNLHIPFGASGFPPHRVENIPEDRTVLESGNLHTLDGRPLREGDKVQIVGFMFDPHPADIGSGEDVNCHQPNVPENDVHINLVPAPAPSKSKSTDSATTKAQRTEALCAGVVAEVIPHHRPAAFEADKLSLVSGRQLPVRITGQLFFDASHHPCRDGTIGRGDPVRGSLWEVHPIYAIDVCRHSTLDQCSATDSSAWAPIETWLATASTANTRPHKRRMR